MTTKNITPFCLKDAPALIEKLFPAQRVSAEAFKEREGRQSQTLTALGSYWKGRKPLILAKACVLGALLPATKNLERDLEIFEQLMAMDAESFVVRLGSPKPAQILATVKLDRIRDYFIVEPVDSLPESSPCDLKDYPGTKGKLPRVDWRDDVTELTRRRIEAQALPRLSYRELVMQAERPESCGVAVHAHIWQDVNAHLGTDAHSMPELVEQLGIMRFGRRPRVADTFSGSGQIPFEAGRLGCDVYASDINPVACMLTWGAFHVIGAPAREREGIAKAQADLAAKVKAEIDALGVEDDGKGWRAKVFLYCMETTCTTSGWKVPMLPTLIVSKGYRVVAKLVPDLAKKRYGIQLVQNATDAQLKAAEVGTVQDGYLVHTVKGQTHRTKISTLRGDYTADDGSTKNRLRLWKKTGITFLDDDIFQERLYAVQWQRTVIRNGKEKNESEFRAATPDDLAREKKVFDYVGAHLSDWQAHGWIPDMVIEPGDKTDEPIRTRGWTYWHHLFAPRHLLTLALVNQYGGATGKNALSQLLNVNCRLSRWHHSSGVGQTTSVFDNQALNTLYNYGARGFDFCEGLLTASYRSFPLPPGEHLQIHTHSADQLGTENDIYITDPPYGDAVKYEEILEFFIAWLRKNPPKEFADWTWDSRRALAIKGEDHDFRLGMVAAYKRMAEKMPDNGIQVLMFTHQSGSIWADMANIVWASGLQVTAAWYVVTETDSALREGSYVKGTVLLVLRKRQGHLETFRDDLAMELEDEVKAQVATLTGLNQETKARYRDENLFSDADLQMAGYAAALRVLTKYATIDGKDMATEALRPRVKGEQTFIDRLISYAVEIANQCLIPSGIEAEHWNRLKPAERFYLKMLDLEAHGHKTLDNYQNFAKAFKVRDFKAMMASEKANAARLKNSIELARAEMSGDSELADTPLRGALYGLMELDKGVDGDEVLGHLADNVPDYMQSRERAIAIAGFLASRLSQLRPDEASNAKVLRDLMRNERLG
jgi:putative DNA methylase